MNPIADLLDVAGSFVEVMTGVVLLTHWLARRLRKRAGSTPRSDSQKKRRVRNRPR